MKLLAVVALAGGLIAAPMTGAGYASGSPWSPWCDGQDCVPYVARNVVQGDPCVKRAHYVFGFDSSGSTLICTGDGEWVQSVPLIGVRTLRAPCYGSEGAAQTADGVPMSCDGQAWSADNTAFHYPDLLGDSNLGG